MLRTVVSSALLCIALSPAAVGATTWEVVPDSNNPPDPVTSGQHFTDALASAVGGDRIHIASGFYQAPVGGWKIQFPLEIYGDGTGDPYMGGAYAGATFLAPAGTNDRVLVFDFTLVSSFLDNIYIHDLTIGQTNSPSPNPNSDGIYCLTPSNKACNARLARLRIANMGHDGIHIEGSNAGAGAIQGLSIEECVSHFNSGRGLLVGNAQMFHLDGGIYSNNGSYGLYIGGCTGPQLNAFECGANQTLYSGGDDSGLFLESNLAFRVTGGHFEDWATGTNVRSAIGVVNARGGYIGSCTFGVSPGAWPDKSGARGIHIWYTATNTGVVIGPNSWSYVPTMIEIQDDPNVTSCVVEAQAMYDYDATHYTPKIIVPEAEGRGHVVVAPVSGGSRILAGIGFPRISTTRRDSLTAASGGGSRREGLVVYNDTAKRLEHWDGARWMQGIVSPSGSERNLPIQTGTIATTDLLTNAPAGLYRVTISAVRTSTGSNRTINLLWTDEGGNHTEPTTLGTGIGTVVSKVYALWISTGSLQFNVQSGGGNYWLRVAVEALP